MKSTQFRNIMKKIIFLFIFACATSIKSHNAGILPYCITDQTRILLGQESAGRARGTWADFGGRGETNESPQKTAIREFSEETRGAYGSSNDAQRAQKQSDLYIKPRMSAEIVHPRGYYSLFLAQVDYKAPQIIKDGPYADREKSNFIWVPARDFINAIKNSDDRENTYYKGLKIRQQLVDYFTNEETLKQIEHILGMRPTKITPKTSEPKEEVWVESYELPYEEAERIWEIDRYERPQPIRFEKKSNLSLKNNLEKLVKKLQALNRMIR